MAKQVGSYKAVNKRDVAMKPRSTMAVPKNWPDSVTIVEPSPFLAIPGHYKGRVIKHGKSIGDRIADEHERNERELTKLSKNSFAVKQSKRKRRIVRIRKDGVAVGITPK